MNLILDQLSYDGKPKSDDYYDTTTIAGSQHPLLHGLRSATHLDRSFRVTGFDNVSPGLVFPRGGRLFPASAFEILDIEHVSHLNHESTVSRIGSLIKDHQELNSNVGVFNAPYQEWWPDNTDPKATSKRGSDLGMWAKRLQQWNVDLIVGQAYNFAPSDKPDWDWIHARWIKSVDYFITNMRPRFPTTPIVMYIWQCLHSNARPAWANQFMPPEMYRNQVRYLLGMKVIPAAWADLKYKIDPNDVSKLVIDRRWTAEEMKSYVEILQEEARR